MKTISTKSEMFKLSQQWQRDGQKVGFVPTMGALHSGHLKLVSEAQKICDKTVVSIFVNPTQFGPLEDFAKYPRPLIEDSKRLLEVKADVLYIPSVDEMYGDESVTIVSSPKLAKVLCGMERPGHFDGVCTVVSKFLNMVSPNIAFFGKKDFQQFLILSRMVKDLNFAVEVIGIETLREADGLAMSSRNRYLSENDRALAPKIYQTMNLVKKEFAQGLKNPKKLIAIFTDVIKSPIFQVEYCEIRDAINLNLFADEITSAARMFVAVKLGATRLIDNLELN